MTVSPVQRGTQALKRFAEREVVRATMAHADRVPDRCELCAAALGERHDHLLELSARRLTCACVTCAPLFPEAVEEPASQRYVRLRPRVRALPLAAVSDQDLIALGIPVRLVLLCPSELHGALYMLYPSASGPIEASAPRELWTELVGRRPELRDVREDRDAVIVDLRSAAPAIVCASLDVAYELLGALRGPSGMPGFEAQLRALKTKGTLDG